MTCREIQDRFVDYLTGDAGPGASRDVRAHVAACGACREELESMTLAWTKLGVLPELKPRPELRTRFYSMLESYKELQAGSEGRAEGAGAARLSARLLSWWPRWPAVQAAVAASLLFIGLLAGALLRPGQARASQIAGLEAEVRDMRQQVSLSLLERPSSSDRLSGLSVAASIRDPNPGTLVALLRTLDEDPSPNVRLAAADALYLFRDSPGVREGLVRSLSLQTSPVVQVALINLLADIREARAAAALKGLIDDTKLAPEVRRKAEWGLKSIV